MLTISVALNILIAGFDETYIQALHLLIKKTVHIQQYGGHTEAPMELCCLAAFSESLTLCHCRAGRQFPAVGSTRNNGNRDILSDYENTVCFFLFSSFTILKLCISVTA